MEVITLNNGTRQKLVNGCMAALIVFSPILAPLTANAAITGVASNVTRIGGVDQYSTAALIAQKGWPATCDNIVLSAGLNYSLVDALAAGPLATALKAPILLTDDGQSLNSSARAELVRLKPKKAYITSGAAVIKPAVLEELKAMGITPVQLGGYDQYLTSVNIAKEISKQGVNISRVILAAGWVSPADALSIASIAAAQGIPILTTTRDQLPASVQTYLDSLKTKVIDSYVVGGTAVVSDTVKGQLPGNVSRYAGLTKYDTNVKILKGFSKEYKQDKVYVANGETLVDALAGVPLAAANGAPVVLVNQQLENTTKDFMKLNMSTADIIVLGGEAVVPSTVINALPTSSPISPGGTTVTPPVSTPSAGGGAVPPTSTTPGTTTTTPGTTTTTPGVQAASATIGGSTVNAIHQADGSWQVDLSTQSGSALFTDVNIVADSTADKATMSLGLLDELGDSTDVSKTISFSNGVANINIHNLLGSADTGAPGLSVSSLRLLGLTTFDAVIKDAANVTTSTVVINLKLN